MSTYTAEKKAYYQKNKERIRLRTRLYKKRYNKLYYYTNRDSILKKLRDDRRIEALKKALAEQQLNQP